MITGTAFTTTLTELDAEVQPFCVTLKLYVPVAAVVAALIVGLALIGLGAFRYDDVAGWGFASVGIGFFAIAWVFNALKGRV